MWLYSYVKRLWLRGGNSVKRNKPSLEHSFSALHSRYLQYYRRKYLNRLLTFSWWRSAHEWHWGMWTIHCLMRVQCECHRCFSSSLLSRLPVGVIKGSIQHSVPDPRHSHIRAHPRHLRLCLGELPAAAAWPGNKLLLFLRHSTNSTCQLKW